MSISRQLKSRLSIETAAALLVIALGLALRLRQYTLNLSFWLDEAMLALNITTRNFTGLVRPLDYDQGAPLGFLWVVKLAETVLGNREYSLRLFPFLAGCLALVVLWRVARQLIQPVGALFALLIFATSSYIISYTAQVKQYAVDGCVTLLLYLVGLRLLRKESSKKELFFLAVFGGLSIWLSHAAAFTLGGLGLVLIWSVVSKKDWRGAFYYGLVSLFWLINFAILYLIQYRGLAANTFLTNFWADFFMPLSFSAPAWTADRLAGLFINPGGIPEGIPSIAMMVLFCTGLICLFLRKNRWVWIFTLSLLLTLAASSLDKYPFGGRMGLFFIPGLFICAGEGLELIRRLFRSRPVLGLAGALILAGALAYAPLSFSIELAFKPKMAENIAPTMAFLQANYHPTDQIYLYQTSIPAFRYYAPKYKLDNALVFNGEDFHQNQVRYLDEVSQLAGNKRVWFLFSHLTDPQYVQDRDYILKAADQIGSKKREFSEPGTLINLYLYDLSP